MWGPYYALFEYNTDRQTDRHTHSDKYLTEILDQDTDLFLRNIFTSTNLLIYLYYYYE